MGHGHARGHAAEAPGHRRDGAPIAEHGNDGVEVDVAETGDRNADAE